MRTALRAILGNCHRVPVAKRLCQPRILLTKESIDDFVIHCLKRAALKSRPHTVEQHRPDESVRGMVVAVGMPVEWFVGIGNVALVGADFLYLNFAEAVGIGAEIPVRNAKAQLRCKRCQGFRANGIW